VNGGVAVVSGGGTGIGEAIAGGLAEDGYRVVIVGRRADVLDNAAAQINRKMGKTDVVRTVCADLTQLAGAEAVATAVEGTVDVIVNNAGGFMTRKEEGLGGTAAWWRANFDSNVLTAVLLTEVFKDRLARPGGRVILLSSIAAGRGGGGPYSAAKAALHGWCYDLAQDLGPDGITVNVVSPGYVAQTEFFGDRITPAGHDSRVATTLVKRAGAPADIAAAVRYLAAPAAGYVTGQVLGVNGGSVFGR
jgi:3-oxoacyl-[acyl-carrier protein] reductase